MRISLDFETRSRADIKACGEYKYAEHESTEVLIIAVSDGGKTITWDIRQKTSPALDLLRRAVTEGWEIAAFNSQFEWAILKHVCTRQFGFPVPDINKMRCTAAVCRTGGLPPSLEKAAEFLKLGIQKDKMGKALIQKFSVPRKDGTFIEHTDDVSFTVGGEKLTAAQAFQRFVDYCRIDVETEMAVAVAMEPFALKGAMLEAFLFDARMNERGFPMDLSALRPAKQLVDDHEAYLTKRFTELTNFTPSQNKRVLEWLQERGYQGASLNVESRLRFGSSQEMNDDAREALALKADLSFAAVKKIPTAINWVMADGRVRGSFLWYGAQKTGRWTSKGIQMQNAKRPPKRLRKIIEEVYGDVRGGLSCGDLIMLYGENPYELLACLVRYFVRHENINVFDTDFSNVEARILPFLIESERIMAKFFSGEDIYVTAEKLLNLEDRGMGKVLILATQFGGGWSAVNTATNGKWTREQCERAAAIIRKENPEFPAAWNKFQDAFVEAYQNPGKWVRATKYVHFGYDRSGPFPRMKMRLPSKRDIIYPFPKADPITMVKIETPSADRKSKTARWERIAGHQTNVSEIIDLMDIGNPFLCPGEYGSHFHTYELSFYGHIEGVTYGRVKTYGGDLLQSATQGTGYDLLVNGCIEAEKQGFDPFMVVHDQCLTSALGEKDELVAALCSVPDWFKGFPLEATCDEERSYCKN